MKEYNTYELLENDLLGFDSHLSSFRRIASEAVLSRTVRSGFIAILPPTLVKNALQMALVQRDPEAGLVHHSDRGSEYASTSYQEMLHQRGIQVSMSRKGDCYDNAMIESFWGTLKEEGIGQEIYRTREEAKTAVFDYIEVFYNRKRKHSSLGYLSPVEYEKQGEKRKGKNS